MSAFANGLKSTLGSFGCHCVEMLESQNKMR